MLLWCNPPLTGSNRTLGRRVVAGCIGDVRMSAERCGAVAIRGSSEGRGTWHLAGLVVMRGALPGMMLCVCHDCVHFVNHSARLVVGLGANMMGGGISYKRKHRKLWRNGVHWLSLLKRHPLFGHPLFGHPLFVRGNIWHPLQISLLKDPFVPRVSDIHHRTGKG